MANILIVDDEPTIRVLIRSILESAGHSTFEARNGQAALDILETFPKPFDIMTLDIHMHSMNGYEFLSVLQDQPFHPLVLVISAHLDAFPQAVAHLVSGRLMKPFSRQALVAMVNSLVSPSIKLPLS